MKADNVNYFRQLTFLLGDQTRRLPLMLLFFVLASSLDILGLWLIPPYLSYVIDQTGDGSSALHGLLNSMFPDTGRDALIIGFGIVLVLLAFVKLILGVLIQKVTVRFGQFQQVRLRTQLIQAYQSMPYARFVERNRSDMIVNIQILAKAFGGIVTMVLQSTSEVIVALAIIMILMAHDPAVLVSVTLVNLFVFGLYSLIFRRRLKALGKTENKAAALLVRGVNESIDGFKEIRVLNREQKFFDMTVEGAQLQAKAQEFRQVVTFVPRYLMEAVVIVVIVCLAIGLTMSGKVESNLLSSLILLGVAGLRLLPIAKNILMTLQQLQYDRNSIQRLFTEFQHLDGQPPTSDRWASATSRHLGSLEDIEFASVGFTYARSNRSSLSEINLKIKAGQRIGIVGASGSGKSTLVDVLLGLLVPAEGKITLNGTDVTRELGHHLSAGYLPQDVFLVDGTLRENVALGVATRDVDDNRVNQALAKARLTAADACFPEGLETTLGERGTRLSGGQKQRVALARAFYFDRKFLVLDEATSALDDKVEAQIIDEVFALSRDITLIIVAHRLSTVKSCDWIFRLENGRIVEEGTPDIVLGSGMDKDS